MYEIILFIESISDAATLRYVSDAANLVMLR